MPSLIGKEIGPIGYGTMSATPPNAAIREYCANKIRNDLERAASLRGGVL
jgi:hypothetical protein